MEKSLLERLGRMRLKYALRTLKTGKLTFFFTLTHEQSFHCSMKQLETLTGNLSSTKQKDS